MKALSPYGPEILSYIYRQITDRSRAQGVVPVWIFLPQVRQGQWVEETPEVVKIAQDAGFLMINMEDVYEKHDVAALRLAEWDDHPNVLGHEVIAQRLYEELMVRRAEIFDRTRR